MYTKMCKGIRSLRRFLASVCILCLLPSGCASSGRGRGEPEHYLLYFTVRDLTEAAGEGALRAVESDLPAVEGADAVSVAEQLLSTLLRGPEEEDLDSTLPPRTALRSLELRGSRALVDFSSAYGSLSGVGLTLADYAVTLTLTQIPEISLVQITVDGQDLAYREKQSFSARDVLLQPEGDVVGTVTAVLYFPNADGDLVGEERRLSLYEGDTQVEAVVQAVEGGPENRELGAAFPEGFRIRGVWQEEDRCLVNLSSALLDTLDTPPSMTLDALERSLRSLDGVRDVRYLVDGEFLREYGGIRLAEPYEIEES